MKSTPEIRELRKFLATDDSVLIEKWKDKIVKIINKDLSTSYTYKEILKKAEISSKNAGDITKTFPFVDGAHKYLSTIAMKLNLSPGATIKIYKKSGLYIDMNNKWDKELISAFGDTLSEDDYNTHLFTDCLLELIAKHDYASDEDSPYIKEMLTYSQNLSTELSNMTVEEKNRILSGIFSTIHKISENYCWILKVTDTKSINSRMRRYSLFEIGFCCNFNQQEVSELYHTMGYHFNTKLVKFDAFISHLFDSSDDYSGRAYEYKYVNSDLYQFADKWDNYSNPSADQLDSYLGFQHYDIDMTDFFPSLKKDDDNEMDRT